MQTFFSGATYLFEGFSLLFARGVKRYVILPVLINIIIFVGAFALLNHWMHSLNMWLMHFLPTWLQWLHYFLWLLFFISFFIFFIYTFVTIANLISAPFNSLLSERVTIHLTGSPPHQPPLTLLQTIKDIPRILWRQCGILGYYLPRAVLLVICFFIPFVQIFAPFLWLLFNAWFLAMTYLDYPTDNERVALEKVKSWQSNHRLLALGFGLAALGVAMMPIINLLAMPAAVAGGTKLWLDHGRLNLRAS